MRSKWRLLIMVAGCYKATGPETCEPVPTSWGAPVERCTVPPVMAPTMVPEAKPEAPPPKTEVTTEQIKLREKVEFETDSAKLLPSSTPVLDEVVTVLKAHTEIEHVRVGGHTDSTATSDHTIRRWSSSTCRPIFARRAAMSTRWATTFP